MYICSNTKLHAKNERQHNMIEFASDLDKYRYEKALSIRFLQKVRDNLHFLVQNGVLNNENYIIDDLYKQINNVIDMLTIIQAKGE